MGQQPNTKSELLKYRKDSSTIILVTTSALRQIRYIKDLFTRANDVTRGQRMQECDVKRKKLEEIKNIYKFNFRDGINMKTMEEPTPYEALFALYSNPVVINVSIKDR